MNRPRTPPAALPDLTGHPAERSLWRWSAAEPEPSGRLLLPAAARRALGANSTETHAVTGAMLGDSLVLRPQAEAGRAITIDSRGRLYLPVWMRRHPGFLIGTHTADDPAVVIVPAALVDAIGDRLLERVR